MKYLAQAFATVGGTHNVGLALIVESATREDACDEARRQLRELSPSVTVVKLDPLS